MPFETETKALYFIMDIAVIFRLTSIFYYTLNGRLLYNKILYNGK